MIYEIEWRPGAAEDMAALFEYLAENASLWDARNVTDRLIAATERLADYPRLYETDERYGEGVRRISLLGQYVLYEVNDEAACQYFGGCRSASESSILSLSARLGAQATDSQAGTASPPFGFCPPPNLVRQMPLMLNLAVLGKFSGLTKRSERVKTALDCSRLVSSRLVARRRDKSWLKRAIKPIYQLLKQRNVTS